MIYSAINIYHILIKYMMHYFKLISIISIITIVINLNEYHIHY